MGAVWVTLGSELRRTWRAWLGLAVIIGLAGGSLIALAAAARRTDSAYDRFRRSHGAADVFLPNFAGPGLATFEPAAVAALPDVASVERLRAVYLTVGERFAIGMSRSGEPSGPPIDQFKVLEGRAADPARADEAVLTLLGAERLGLKAGGTFPLNVDEEFIPSLGAAARLHPLTIRVVGVVAAPGTFPPHVPEQDPDLIFTPAFFRTYPNAQEGVPDQMLVRLRRGAADVAGLRAHLTRLSGGRQAILLDDRHLRESNVRRPMHLQAIALWLAALVGAAFTAAVVAQALARQLLLSAEDHRVLRALGMSRVHVWLLGMLRVLATSTVGLTLAVPLAVALSPLAPTGLARTAEPSPGIAFDAAAIGIGAVAVIGVFAALAGLPAWIASGARADASDPRVRPAIAGRVARRLGASIQLGARMALDPGRGRGAVPVRTALAGATLGLAGLVAAASFGASLDRLLEEPRLYGVAWEMQIETDEGNFADSWPALARIPGIEGISIGTSGLPVEVNGTPGEGLLLDRVFGSVAPPVLEGRLPATPRSPTDPTEAALGSRLMDTLGVHIGDTVSVRLAGLEASLDFRVVGRAVIPVGESTQLGDGLLASFEAIIPYAPAELEPERIDQAFVSLRPGADRQAVMKAIDAAMEPFDVYPADLPAPTDIVNFGRVRSLPEILAGLLALVAATTLAHTLVSGVRRRRRDLAVLKALGFVRGQVRWTISAQASTVVVVALVAGLPLGIAVGRWFWTLLAEGIGALVEPVTPRTVYLAIPAALVLANLVAALPARSAARTKPALVLRAE